MLANGMGIVKKQSSS